MDISNYKNEKIGNEEVSIKANVQTKDETIVKTDEVFT